MSDADRAQPHIGVAQHHTFGTARRAGRVKQSCKRLWVDRGGRQRLGIEQRGSLFLIQCPAPRRNIGFVKRGTPCFACHEQRCPAVGQNVRDLAALQHGIDRHVDEAGPRTGEWQKARHTTFGNPARYSGTLG